MKYIAYIDHDNHGEIVDRKNGGGAYAATYNTNRHTEQELFELCRKWEAEDKADGLNREYFLEEAKP